MLNVKPFLVFKFSDCNFFQFFFRIRVRLANVISFVGNRVRMHVNNMRGNFKIESELTQR